MRLNCMGWPFDEKNGQGCICASGTLRLAIVAESLKSSNLSEEEKKGTRLKNKRRHCRVGLYRRRARW